MNAAQQAFSNYIIHGQFSNANPDNLKQSFNSIFRPGEFFFSKRQRTAESDNGLVKVQSHVGASLMSIFGIRGHLARGCSVVKYSVEKKTR